ncbi:MAG: hypothetical protein Q6373_024440 [Candidatus Sigynarchaeota archaeon]
METRIFATRALVGAMLDINIRGWLTSIMVQGRLIWFTTIGWSPMAAANTIWAHVNGYKEFPGEIKVFCETGNPKIRANLDVLRGVLRAIQAATVQPQGSHVAPVAITPVELGSEDIATYADAVEAAIDLASREPGARIVIDITPGRKFMSLVGGMLGFNYPDKIARVMYNHLYTDAYLNTPLPLIPRPEWQVIDVLRSLRKAAARNLTGDELRAEALDVIAKSGGVARTSIARQLRDRLFSFNSDDLDRALEMLKSAGTIVEIPGGQGTRFHVKGQEPSVEAGEYTERVSLDELVLIFNVLHGEGYSKHVIEACPFGNAIFTFSFNGKGIDLAVDKRPFGAPPSIDDPAIAESIRKELDLPNEWHRLLVMAGIIKPVNLSEIITTIKATSKQDQFMNRPTVVCMDTNLYINQFYSMLAAEYLQPPRERTFKDARIGFLLSRLVYQELEFDAKIREADRDAMLAIVRSPGACQSVAGSEPAPWLERACHQLLNQDKFAKRVKAIGFDEYTRVAAREYTTECNAGRAGDGYDARIIHGVKEFTSARDANVILLSADHDFSRYAGSLHNVGAVQVRYPATRDMGSTFSITWGQLAKLLHCTAILYGAAIVTGIGEGVKKPLLLVQGAWTAKTGDDWNAGLVKVTGSRALLGGAARDLGIMRAIGRK